MAAEPEVSLDGDHYVVEMAVKRVAWKPSTVAHPGGRMVHDGPPTRHVNTMVKVVTTSVELEAAVAKARRVLDIEVGDDA